MKIVVIGGTGLIGSKLVNILRKSSHEVVAASPNSGVNTITCEGLAEALDGAEVVVDVSNSPSFEDTAVMEFFTTSTGNFLKYEKAAGVRHHVALSVVGTDRLQESGYFRAKLAQEELIKGSPIAYSIIRGTQFFEFIKPIADTLTVADTVHVPPVFVQPIAADEVADELSKVTTAPPVNGTVDLAGPEQFRLDELIRQVLQAGGDPRGAVADSAARYFGAELNERTLVPADHALLGTWRFEDWLRRSTLTAKHAA